MQRAVLWCLLLCLCAGPLAAQDAALMARDSAWNQLRLSGDAAGLEALLAADWVLTHSDGRQQDRRAYLDELRRGAGGGRVNTVIRNEDVVVRQHGDVAVITGTSVQAGTGADGQPFSGRFRFTRTWLRHEGAWVMLASHSSRIAVP
ncbi:MAG: nuclear transport factor 2 family protein [Gemmatimonadaceae bacterium]|nr:nuclear transport factor 2 family protein [Gemmatimonadaceae bacterium]